MKITGGEAKGRNIFCIAGKQVRPTTSKMRQALFNILYSKVHNSKFLDVFAGTGLVGLEAMSRGAATLAAIEENRAVANLIERSAKHLNYSIELINLDFRQALKLLYGQKFDLIFADPPYESNFGQIVLELVSKYQLLDSKGTLIIEHKTNIQFDLIQTTLINYDTRKYGQSAFSFFYCN